MLLIIIDYKVLSFVNKESIKDNFIFSKSTYNTHKIKFFLFFTYW